MLQSSPLTIFSIKEKEGKKQHIMSGNDEEDRAKNGEDEAFQNSSSSIKICKGNLITAASDDNLNQVFRQIKSSKSPTVINYGASCQILPAFCRLCNEFPKLSFVYADIDKCPETTQRIRYTPTFQFYRDGERVDEMFGGGEERLRDRVWLHS
ncbi:thioredoxin-like 3-3 isoform X2 [Andrographis paniculata]|uniref:thioredoxin-like 3-3 isoform X2 n=1 Tax=Andrographis paniculata TaxID=175694 RepID=UPI0021E7070B|nr:thioredoxin-like 3-3 isoform X2 [Andrographis paniculata]